MKMEERTKELIEEWSNKYMKEHWVNLKDRYKLLSPYTLEHLAQFMRNMTKDDFGIIYGKNAEEFINNLKKKPTKKQIEFMKECSEVYKKTRRY